MSDNYDISRIDGEKYPLVEDLFCRVKDFDRRLPKKDFHYIEMEVESAKALCDELKRIAIQNNDESTANYSFLIRINFELMYAMARFWKLCEELEYEKAWNYLQDSLDSTRVLMKFLNGSLRLDLMDLYKYLSAIEQLYPPHIFSSVGNENCTVKCSICGRSPFDPECAHISGELYWGEMAHHVIENIGRCDHIAITLHPEDKRCVIGFVVRDKNNRVEDPFPAIHSFILHSQRPFREFKLKKTDVTVPREDINPMLNTGPCPCGSGLPFKKCCYNKEFITIPHYEAIFEEPES